MEGGFPGLRHLVGVGRADDGEVGNGAQGGHLFDRLMGGPVFADADAVVGEDEDGGHAHEGGEADAGAHVVAEDEKGATVGNNAAVQGHAVEDGAHAVFTHAEAEVAAAVGDGLKVRAAADDRLVAGREVGAATDEIGDDGCEGVEGIAAGVAGGRAASAVEGGQCVFPAGWKLALQHRAELGGKVRVGGGVGIPQGAVGGFEPFAALYGLEAEVAHVVGQKKCRLLGPFEVGLGLGDFFIGKGVAVHVGLALFGGAEADDGGATDEAGAGILFGGGDGGVDGGTVHAVHFEDVPAVGFEALVLVLGEGQVGVAVDGDAVVIVEVDQFAKAQVAGEAGRFLGRRLP